MLLGQPADGRHEGLALPGERQRELIGPALVPGKASESVLIQVLEGRHTDFPRMPYKKPPLRAEEIARIRTWINDGAKAPAESVAHQRRIDRLIEGNDEHVAMLRQLEAAYDTAFADGEPLVAQGPLPTGDDIAAEFEQFLRDQGE